MNSDKEKYSHKEQHLSRDQMIRYQEGKMSDAEMQRVEEHAASCALCEEAMEGYAMLPPEAIKSSLAELKNRLGTSLSAHKQDNKNTYWKWGIAASFLLLLSIGTFYFVNNLPDTATLTQKENTESVEPEFNPPQTVQKTDKESKADPEPEMAYLDQEEAEPYLTTPEVISGQRKIEESIPEPTKNIAEPTKEVKQVREEIVPPMELEIEEATILEEFNFNETQQIASGTKKKEVFHTFEIVAPAPGQTNEMESSRLKSKLPKREERPAIKTINGIVTDAQSGEALPGVNVGLKGTSIQTATNLAGEYSLDVPLSEDSLLLSFIGYKNKALSLNQSTALRNISLEPDTKNLNEVVVADYSTQRKRAVTGAVTSIDLSAILLPEPENGMRQYKKYLRDSIQYPAAAIQDQKEGVVKLSFYVEPDGSLSDIQILNSLGYGLDKEAIRLIKEGPEWKPATTKEGNTIKSPMVLEVPFKLK